MANRYWVGGTGTWDASGTSHWSDTSGGSSGFSVPIFSDNVFIDANSGTGTITADYFLCADFDCTGYTGTFVMNAFGTPYGNFTLSSGMTYSTAASKSLNFLGGNTSITTNGHPVVFTVFKPGSTLTLLDDLTIESGRVFSFNAGTLDMNGFNFTGDSLDSSSSTNNITIDFGSGTTTLLSKGLSLLNTGTRTLSGTGTIKLITSGSTNYTQALNGGTFGTFWISGTSTGTYTITGANTFDTFKIDTGTIGLNITATQTVTNFDVNGVSSDNLTIVGFAAAPTISTFTSSGTWVCPALVTSVTVQAWGGGGAGGGPNTDNTGGGGGAGGQFVTSTVSVTPGNTYTVTVGAGGTGVQGNNGNSGGDSILLLSGTPIVTAKGGAGGSANITKASGSTTGGVGDTVYAGGDGSDGASTYGGGGGGGSGTTGAGGNASTYTGGTGTSTGGGNGGDGRQTTAGMGLAGSVYGGGGGGGFRTTTTNRLGGAGGAGRIIIDQPGVIGTSFTKSSGAVISNYLDLTDVKVDGGATWYAISSVDGGDNTGWNFRSPSNFLQFM
jgi:hypothetical protein